MIEVKICGMTRFEDICSASREGADWIGFVFHAPSPRSIAMEEARTLIDRLRGEMKNPPGCVGVFVDADPRDVHEVVHTCGLNRVQLHGHENRTDFDGVGVPVMQAYPLSGTKDLETIQPAPGEVFLVDSANGSGFGGTGQIHDWKLAARAALRGDMFLAGGLDPENIVKALDTVHPHGVDASSRLESAPGIKNPERIREFIQEIRTWETRMRTGISDDMAAGTFPKQ